MSAMILAASLNGNELILGFYGLIKEVPEMPNPLFHLNFQIQWLPLLDHICLQVRIAYFGTDPCKDAYKRMVGHKLWQILAMQKIIANEEGMQNEDVSSQRLISFYLV